MVGYAKAAASHPFVGEHANKNAVHHPDGSISQRLGAKPASFNKHESYMGGDGLFEPDLGIVDHASQALFGTYKSEFEKGVEQHVERREQHKKLGQMNFATILKNEDGFMWTGELYMGRLSKVDVVYDTGSDWLVVEGADCTTCQGNTYDPQPSIDTGLATVVSETQSERNYGSASLKGREYTDTVCILFSACVPEFEYFLIED